MKTTLMTISDQTAMKTIHSVPLQRLLRVFAQCLIALCMVMPLGAESAPATETRTSAFVYDPDSGLLTKEIIEPSNPNLCVVTEYTYDHFGNKTSAITRNCNGSADEAAAPAPGSDAVFVSRTDSVTYTYTLDGSSTTFATNALGHSETKVFEAAFGNATSLTGPNNLATTWQYDTFGRKKLETRADATTTSWAYSQPCDWVNANLPNAVYCVGTLTTGIGRWTRTHFDTLNRELATTRMGFTNINDEWVDEGRIDYDTMGRVAKSYRPYKWNNVGSAKYATFTYDILGRVLTETAPDGIDLKEITYSGLQTTVTRKATDGSIGAQTQITIKNSQGQVTVVTDDSSKSLVYQYDPFGNLVKTTDSLGNVITMAYDPRGRKTSMNDPDLGIWAYAYNALGELIRQNDAKGQSVTMQYDKLGRMISRTEPDLISTWTYDTATKGIGKLAAATSSNGYSRTHAYDTLGRPSSTSTIIDNAAAPYVTSVTYDSAGRVETQTYPASATHPTGFAVKNVYNTVGYLTQVVNAATPTTVYWTANAMDEANRLIQQTYGNGVVTTQVYDPATGRLTRQLAGTGNAVQDMSYQYDSMGNLQTRTDANNNLLETFGYDNLNRLTIATAIGGAVSAASLFDYNELGNITSKSGVGAYTYTPNPSCANTSIRPHAVGSITGTVNGVVNPIFCYDSNGNMESGSGRSTVWTSFNMPSQITNGTKTASFWYNSEHERIKELQTDGSIVITLSPRYDTGLHFEKKYMVNGSVEYEHYLYADGLLFGKYITINNASGVTTSTKVEYYSKDHLGSIVAITDQQGNIVIDGSGQPARYSYDVWGKRRYPTGEPNPPNNPDMYHGYTGHEMLDDVGLIHMNGRLYDPVLARFLSADPTIQNPLNLQSYNRYSYVWNNPLASNDPSGFEMSCMYGANDNCPGDAPPSLPEVPVAASPWPEEDVGGGTFNGFVPVDDNSFSDRNNLGTWSEPLPKITDYPFGFLLEPVGDLIGLAFNGSINPLTHEYVKMDGTHRIETLAGIVLSTPFGKGLSVAKGAIGATGKVGERALKALGGESQVYFKTTQGGRYIDQLVNGVANESKVGYTTLTADISRQIQKDVELMQTKQIQGATWNFFVSPVTGAGGPSQPLLQMLQQNGINVIIH